MSNPYALHREVENAYLVREKDRRLLRELAAVVAAVTVLGTALFAYTWVHTEILLTGYRVNELEKNLHILKEEERRRRLEASYLAHPTRLEERARDELGMLAPTLDQTVFFDEVAER